MERQGCAGEIARLHDLALRSHFPVLGIALHNLRSGVPSFFSRREKKEGRPIANYAMAGY